MMDKKEIDWIKFGTDPYESESKTEIIREKAREMGLEEVKIEFEGPPLPPPLQEKWSPEKLREKSPQELVEMIEKIDHLVELRKKQGELLEELRRTLLLEWFGDAEKEKYINYKRDGRITWESLRFYQLKKLWERVQEWAKNGIDRRAPWK